MSLNTITAVIINEHLMEALRRLRQNSTSTNVDRRLVTNVLLSFLATPRADPKRFEMLKLLASVLSWSDAEREKAGLQRGSGGLGASPTGSVSGFWGRSTSQTNSVKELEKTDETEVQLNTLLPEPLAHVFSRSVVLSPVGGVFAHGICVGQWHHRAGNFTAKHISAWQPHRQHTRRAELAARSDQVRQALTLAQRNGDVQFTQSHNVQPTIAEREREGRRTVRR